MRCFAIFLMLIISIQINGQDRIRILGKVDDYLSGEVIDGASILAIDPLKQFAIDTMSSHDGTFELFIPLDINKIEISITRYRTDTIKFDHSNDIEKRLSISLIDAKVAHNIPNYEKLLSKIDTSLKYDYISGIWQVTSFRLNDFVRNQVANKMIEYNLNDKSEEDYKGYNFRLNFKAYKNLNGKLGLITYGNACNTHSSWGYVIIEENVISLQDTKIEEVTSAGCKYDKTIISFTELMKYFSNKTKVVIWKDKITMELNGNYLEMKKMK